MNIPGWWIDVSGICFISSIVLNLAVIFGGIVAWRKIGPLISEAQKQVKTVGDKATDIAITAKDTVEKVHDRADRILGTAETASSQVTQRIGAASTALTAIFVGLRIMAFARGMMHHEKRDGRRARS